MNTTDLYNDLDSGSRDRLTELAKEIQRKYQIGPRKGEPQGRVILFLGAAVNYEAPEGFELAYSKEERPPIAAELRDSLIDVIFEDQKDEDRKNSMKEEHLTLSYVAQYYEELTDRARLIDSLVPLISREKPSPILKALAKMDFKYIITTNYDHLFENALEQVGKSYRNKGIYKANKGGNPKSTDNVAENEITVHAPFLYKFHGDLREVTDGNGIYIPENDNIVITDDDYLNFILRMSQINDNQEKPEKEMPGEAKPRASVLDLYPIPRVINEAFAGKNQNTFLFIGYGLQDYNLRLIFKTSLWGKNAKSFNDLQKWSITLDKHKPIQQFWFRNHKVTFIEQNIWSAIPFLYKEIFNKEMPL